MFSFFCCCATFKISCHFRASPSFFVSLSSSLTQTQTDWQADRVHQNTVAPLSATGDSASFLALNYAAKSMCTGTTLGRCGNASAAAAGHNGGKTKLGTVVSSGQNLLMLNFRLSLSSAIRSHFALFLSICLYYIQFGNLCRHCRRRRFEWLCSSGVFV